MSVADKLQTIAENEQKVYDAGKKSQYDEFWDTYQLNGNRTNYLGAFAGGVWSKLFKPKYNMRPSVAYFMFRSLGADFEGGTQKIDLVSKLEEYGVTLDFSNCTDLGCVFQWSRVTKVGVIDASSALRLDDTFNNAILLNTIDKIISHDNLVFYRTFSGCDELQKLTIEGTIGQNGFNVGDCTKLSKASIISIVNALSSTTSGLTVTLSKTAVDNAFPTSGEVTDGEVTDLTGTSWVIDSITATEGFGIFNVDFHINDDNTDTAILHFLHVGYDISEDGTTAVPAENSIVCIDNDNNYVKLNIGDKITFIGGETTNSNLISFIKANCTRKLNEWEELIATKSNWNISLV